MVAFAVIVQAYWTLNVDGSNIILRGDIAPPDECMKIDKSGKRRGERGRREREGERRGKRGN